MINKMKIMILQILALVFISSFTACSNYDNKINSLQEVQSGTIVTVKRIIIRAEPVRPNGNVGVSVGSGGHAGLYGAIDILTLGSIFGIKKQDKIMQKIIVRRSNGSLVSVTQPFTSSFDQGEPVKIIQRKGEARVIH